MPMRSVLQDLLEKQLFLDHVHSFAGKLEARRP